jgi:ligand-binding SRPBCC domain-containing protein
MPAMVFERSTFIASSAEEVFAFFSRPENLATITPPSLGFTILKLPPGGIQRGRGSSTASAWRASR